MTCIYLCLSVSRSQGTYIGTLCHRYCWVGMGVGVEVGKGDVKAVSVGRCRKELEFQEVGEGEVLRVRGEPRVMVH